MRRVPAGGRLTAVLRHALALALLAGAAAPAPAQTLGLGRLFTTPQERNGLDLRRGSAQLGQQTAGGVPMATPTPVPDAAPPAPPPAVQLNGVVRRSSGKSTVWINEEAHADSDAQLRPDQSVKLRLSSGRELVLKPGQSFNPADGTIQEAAGR
ncbi:MAG: hypothetical protein V4578_19760 [Pseudomonadota bacterium]